MTARVAVSFAALLPLAGCEAPAPPPAAPPNSPRPQRVLAARTGEGKAAAYQELFLGAGPQGLAGLTADEDTGVALQAAWELHTKAARRPQPVEFRTDWVYDQDALGRFSRS
jgi:hypothetical protein